MINYTQCIVDVFARLAQTTAGPNVGVCSYTVLEVSTNILVTGALRLDRWGIGGQR